MMIEYQYTYSDYYDLAKTLESGQAFRFEKTRTPDGLDTFEVYDGSRRCCVYQDLNASCSPIGIECEEEDLAYWENYFGFEPDEKLRLEEINRFEDAICHDPFLCKVHRISKGVHLLNQDPWQTLISFIISQQRSIPAIKSAVWNLCERHGELSSTDDFNEFPTPEIIASLAERDLKALGLGYRAPYLSRTSRIVQDTGFDMGSIHSSVCSPDKSYEVLLRFPGVGKKIANCVMLFGLGYRNIFPVDVWIDRALTRWGKTADEVLDQYGELSGLIQQYIYYAMITTKGKF